MAPIIHLSQPNAQAMHIYPVHNAGGSNEIKTPRTHNLSGYTEEIRNLSLH